MARKLHLIVLGCFSVTLHHVQARARESYLEKLGKALVVF
jgi:hypothetical protein